MAKLPLLEGAYTTRGLIAECQRCVNLYPEINPKDAPQPISHYPTPGLSLLVNGGEKLEVGPVRGLYFAANEKLYAVVGTGVYYVDSSFSVTKLGTIAPKLTPVSMKDNGITLVIVDGTAQGYTVDLATNAFGQVVDGSGLFVGADSVDYLDTFLVFNQPGTRNFYSSLSNSVSFDALYIAAKTASSDLLQTLIVNHRIIWLLGTFTSEPWYNAGNPAFPFALQPGVFVQYGCCAKYSACSDHDSIFWLSQDKNGRGLVIEGKGLQAKVVSTPAISQQFAKYATLTDAVGFIYQQAGHIFYVLNFPSADKTWVYDKTTGLWHERCSVDGNGVEHRHRANCHAMAYGVNVVGDWQNGNLYKFDLEVFTDAGTNIVRRRGFPHVVTDGKRAVYAAFMADIEVGSADNVMWGTPTNYTPPDWKHPADFSDDYSVDFRTDEAQRIGQQNDDFSSDYNEDFATGELVDDTSALDTYTGPMISLRWSDDRGRTWSDPVLMPIGASGEFFTTPTWRRLGVARYRTFELFWSVDAEISVQGAFVDVVEGAS